MNFKYMKALVCIYQFPSSAKFLVKGYYTEDEEEAENDADYLKIKKKSAKVFTGLDMINVHELLIDCEWARPLSVFRAASKLSKDLLTHTCTHV